MTAPKGTRVRSVDAPTKAPSAFAPGATAAYEDRLAALEAEIEAAKALSRERRMVPASALVEALTRERLRTWQLLALARTIDGNEAVLKQYRKQRASADRPKARSTLLKRLKTMMKPYRQGDTEFKVFLSSWVRERTLDDLTLDVSGEKYKVTDDIGEEAREYTFKTLKKHYSQANYR